jgi:hypothetical protein
MFYQEKQNYPNKKSLHTSLNTHTYTFTHTNTMFLALIHILIHTKTL